MFWIRPRRYWGARRPNEAFTKDNWKNGVTVVLHHSADAGPRSNTVRDEKRYLQSIQTFHQQSRGWIDIGYNYIVMPSGRVYEGRGWQNRGAHVLDHNTDTLGILVPGTYTGHAPTERALSGVEKLCNRLTGRGAKLLDVVGHRDLGSTACPGTRFYQKIPSIRRKVL